MANKPQSEHQKEQAIARLQQQLRGLRETHSAALKTIERDGSAGVKRLASEIATAEAQLRELRPLMPADELAGLETEIAGTEAELRQLDKDRSAAIKAAAQSEPEAVNRLAAMDEEIDEAKDRLETLRAQQSDLQQRVASDRGADHRRAEATPVLLADLARNRVKLAAALAAAMHTASEAARALEANGAEIARLEPAAVNVMQVGAFRARLINAFARDFAIDPNKPLSPSNSLLGFGSSTVGDNSRWSLLDWEQTVIDDCVRVYPSEAEAEEARLRLERRSSRTIVLPLHGVFLLVPHERVFGDEAAARRAAAASALPTAMVVHNRAHVLIPVHLAEAG